MNHLTEAFLTSSCAQRAFISSTSAAKWVIIRWCEKSSISTEKRLCFELRYSSYCRWPQLASAANGSQVVAHNSPCAVHSALRHGKEESWLSQGCSDCDVVPAQLDPRRSRRKRTPLIIPQWGNIHNYNSKMLKKKKKTAAHCRKFYSAGNVVIILAYITKIKQQIDITYTSI